MHLSTSLFAGLAIGLAGVHALAVPAPVGTFVSTKVQTYYSSRCSTVSGTASVAAVSTRTTANANMPGVAISSTNTFTPLSYASVTVTPTVTVTAFATPAPVRRELEKRSTITTAIDGQVYGPDGAAIGGAPPSANGLHRRALYPNQVNCAVTTMVMTTSFFTATATSRLAGTTTVTATTGLPTVVVNDGTGPFVLRLGAVIKDVGGYSSTVGKYLRYDGNYLFGTDGKASASGPYYLQPSTGYIVTADGNTLGYYYDSSDGANLKFYTPTQAATSSSLLVKASFRDMGVPNTYQLIVIGSKTRWFFCTLLAIVSDSYGPYCPTWDLWAVGV